MSPENRFSSAPTYFVVGYEHGDVREVLAEFEIDACPLRKVGNIALPENKVLTTMDFHARSSFFYVQKIVEWIEERRTARPLECRCSPTTIARSINDRFGKTEFRTRHLIQLG